MNPITTGYATFPSTLGSGSATNTPATTVTKTITRTVHIKAATSAVAVAASSNIHTSARAFTAPADPFDKVNELYKHTNFRAPFAQVDAMTPALKYVIGVVIAGGIVYRIRNRSPPVTPGEVPRTWKQKVKFASAFLKGTLTGNAQLRKRLAKAREDLVKAQQKIEAHMAKIVEKSLVGNDERLEKENKGMLKQMRVCQAQIMVLEAEKEAQKLRIDVLAQAQPHVPPQGLSQALQRVDDLEDEKQELGQKLAELNEKLDSTEGNKLQLQMELQRALQEQDGVRQQVEEVDKQKQTLTSEYGTAVKTAENLLTQLGQIGQEKATLETELSSVTKHTASSEQQLAELEPEKTLLEQLKMVHQKSNQLWDEATLLQAEKNGLREERDGFESRVKTLKKNAAALAQRLQTAELEAQKNKDNYEKALGDDVKAQEYAF